MHNTNKTSNMRPVHHRGVALAILSGAFALWPQARAEQILASQTVLVAGTAAETFALNAPSAGTVDVTITDLGWPTAMKSLSFSASTATSVLETTLLSGSNSYELSVTGPLALYAHISGEAASLGIPGLPSYGLFSFQAMFTPLVSEVPLPSGAWLMASGLFAMMGIGLLARRFTAARGGLQPVLGY